MIYCTSCRTCGKYHLINMTKEQFHEYIKPKAERKNIQDIFPELRNDEREILVSGICGECFDEMFKEGDG